MLQVSIIKTVSKLVLLGIFIKVTFLKIKQQIRYSKLTIPIFKPVVHY